MSTTATALDVLAASLARHGIATTGPAAYADGSADAEYTRPGSDYYAHVTATPTGSSVALAVTVAYDLSGLPGWWAAYCDDEALCGEFAGDLAGAAEMIAAWLTRPSADRVAASLAAA